MPVIGITGGIASGKSTVTAALMGRIPGRLVDADAVVRELLAQDTSVRAAVEAAFGPGIFGCDPEQDRARLRQQVFSDPAKRARLEGILHPVVRARWVKEAQTAREGGGWLYVDIPLLFETGAETYFDQVIVVACGSDTQRQRMRARRGIGAQIAEQILGAQLDPSIKIGKADHVIWNDSNMEALEAQVDLLARWLQKRYG